VQLEPVLPQSRAVRQSHMLSQPDVSIYIDTSSSHDSGTAVLIALLPTITQSIDSFYSQLPIKDLDIPLIT
jgi:hypothetical protein